MFLPCEQDEEARVPSRQGCADVSYCPANWLEDVVIVNRWERKLQQLKARFPKARNPRVQEKMERLEQKIAQIEV
jgi:hypothetical protein